MGLLIKLQNGDTALKSLKFGNDRPGGGDSGQPYAQDPILDNLTPESKDFLLRGGSNASKDAAQDVVRLTKYMFDSKSPSGLLFIAKQNLLSRTAPKTEASKGLGYAGGILNGGVYTPLSTLAQAGVGFRGNHLNKQGIDPTGLIPGLSIRDYEKVAYNNNLKEANIILGPGNAVFKNRLLDLWWDKNVFPSPTSDPSLLKEYGGGPGSILGIGKTKIKFAKDNSGEVPLRTISTYKGAWDYKTISSINPVSTDPNDLSYKSPGGILPDFRSRIKEIETPSTFLAVSPGYNDKNNLETRYNLNNPGQKGNVSQFTEGKRSITTGAVIGPLDTVNAYPLYKSRTGAITNDSLTDMIPFNIAILNNDLQTGKNDTSYSWKKFIHFRAFIDSFSDSYGADWDSITYMGRAEKFYKYKGFNRDISLDFTVVAQSRQELGIMYDKLNFLASSLAPEYLDSANAGYMAGNIAYLTMGDYIIDQPGIITGFTYNIDESSWELSRDEYGESFTTSQKEKGEIRQLPIMIKVTGFKFIPIHKFRVEKVRWPNDGLGDKESDILSGNINQKYIDPLFKKTSPTLPKRNS